MPEHGGPSWTRTDDLLNAIEALFQLSYGPGTDIMPRVYWGAEESVR